MENLFARKNRIMENRPIRTLEKLKVEARHAWRSLSASYLRGLIETMPNGMKLANFKKRQHEQQLLSVEDLHLVEHEAILWRTDEVHGSFHVSINPPYLDILFHQHLLHKLLKVTHDPGNNADGKNWR